jgi:hypothetical protein
MAHHSTDKLRTLPSGSTISPAQSVRVGRSRLLSITEPDMKSQSIIRESEDNDKYDVEMDAEPRMYGR